MASSFYDPGEQRAVKVNELFTRIAPRYDLINDLQSFGLHRIWKRRLVSLAHLGPGDRALDICCGTGDLAFALARRGVEVTGLDFSEAMLKVAENRRTKTDSPKSKVQRLATGGGSSTSDGRSEERATPNPRFVLGDAQKLPFPAGHFDIVSVGYGLRNLTNWETGLSEMARVAKPGGRLLVLDFGKPPNRAWRAIYFAYLRLFVPVLGRLFAGSASAYSYILESLDPYPAQAGVEQAMRKLGLINVRVLNLLGGVMSINHGQKPG